MKVELNTDICGILNAGTYWTGLEKMIREDAWDEFTKLMIDEAEKHINKWLDHTVFKHCKVTMGKFYVPKEFNHADTSIDFTIEFGELLLAKIKAGCYNDFFEWAEENHGSYNGFYSWYPTKKDKFLKAIEEHKETWNNQFELAVSMFIEYQLDSAFGLEKIKNEFYQTISDEINERGLTEDEEETA